MATCITVNAWKDSVRKEKQRLAKLEEEGFDISNALSDLLALDNAWMNKNADEFGRTFAKVKVNERATKVSSFTIGELNKNNPKDGKKPIKIINGYVSNGKVVYGVQYKSSDKIYNVKAERIETDQMDATLSNVLSDLNATLDDNIRFDSFDREVDEALTDKDKAKQLIDELRELDAVTDTDEHIADLKEFVDMFVGSGYTSDIKTYLKTNQAKTTGKFTFDTVAETGSVKIGIGNTVRQAKNEMSAATKWVHEVGHAVTEFALRRKDPETRTALRRLRELREETRKVISWEDLMPSTSLDAEVEEKIAKDLWNYMFNNTESGMSEFLVHAITNPEVKEALKKVRVYKGKEKESGTMFEAVILKLRELFNRLVALGRGESFRATGDELAINLAKTIAMSNNKAAKFKREATIVSKVYDKISDVEDKLRTTLDKVKDKIENKPIANPPVGKGKIENIKYVISLIPHLVGNENVRTAYENTLSAFGAKPEKAIQTWLRRMSENDSLGNIVEQLDALSQQIDSRRETMEAVTEKQIVETFEKKLSEVEMNSLTVSGLDTDLEVLIDNYSQEELAKLFKDEKALKTAINKKIKEVKTKAENDRDFNWMVNQANGLGYYMATYVANENQNMNARNIVLGYGRAVQKTEADPELVKLVDELASLNAIKYTSKDYNEKFGTLIEEDYKGIKNFVYVHRNFKQESKRKLFYGDDHRVIKGYTKEISNSDIDIKVKPIRDKAEMESAGYELLEVVDSNKNLGLFINKDQSTPNYTKQAMRLTDSGKKGTSIHDTWRLEGGEGSRNKAKKEVAEAKLRMLKMSKAQEESIGLVDREDAEWGLSPMFNANGEAVDFRFMMNKARKKAILEQDMRAPKVLGRMIAGIQDKVETKEHNDNIVKAVLKDMEENYPAGKRRSKISSKNNKEYIKIDKDSTNEEIADLWKILPEDVKEQFKSVEEGVYVRRDMLHMYFGNRDYSLAYSKYGRKLPNQIKHIVRAIELFWQDLIKLAKVEIIIKTPAVIIGNVVSNFLYGVMDGNNPIDVLRLQLDAVKDMREFMNLNRELIELEIARKSGNINEKDLGRLATLKEDISKHPMKDFASEGLFQAIIEDVGLNEFTNKSRVTGKIEDYLDKVPKVKKGLEWAYLSERTGFFKAVTAATQLSDAAARKAKMDLDKRKYDKLVNRGISKRNALRRVFLLKDSVIDDMVKDGMKYDDIYKRMSIQSAREAFVNYSGEDQLTKYLNDMGLVMFTKYVQRIQKVIKKSAIQHPLQLMLLLIGQHYVTGELDTIDDKFLSMPYSPDYLDRVLDLVVPASLDVAGDAYSFAT